jgi:hypothetical protein
MVDNAVTRFRRAIEALDDELHELADSSGNEDQRDRLEQIREQYSATYTSHCLLFVHEAVRTPEEWREVISIALTMAPSAHMTPREWFATQWNRQWGNEARLVMASFALVDRVIGRQDRAEAERCTRIRLRQLYDEHAADGPTTPRLVLTSSVSGLAAALAPPKPSALLAPPPTSTTPTILPPMSAAPFEPPSATASAIVVTGPDPPSRSDCPSEVPAQAELSRRRNLYSQFVAAYRQARDDHKPTQKQIANAGHYTHLSAVAKYLNGEASEECAHAIEEVLKLTPDDFDYRLSNAKLKRKPGPKRTSSQHPTV